MAVRSRSPLGPGQHCLPTITPRPLLTCAGGAKSGDRGPARCPQSDAETALRFREGQDRAGRLISVAGASHLHDGLGPLGTTFWDWDCVHVSEFISPSHTGSPETRTRTMGTGVSPEQRPQQVTRPPAPPLHPSPLQIWLWPRTAIAQKAQAGQPRGHPAQGAGEGPQHAQPSTEAPWSPQAIAWPSAHTLV